MTDSSETVSRKIGKAYCPPGEINENPVLEYCRYIILEKFPKIEIKREKKYGGTVTLSGYTELEKSYSQGKIHPADLKNAVVFYLNELLEPVRRHFQENASARQLKEEVESFTVTR